MEIPPEEFNAERLRQIAHERTERHVEKLKTLAPLVSHLRQIAERQISTTAEELLALIPNVNNNIYDTFMMSGLGVETRVGLHEIEQQSQLMKDIICLHEAGLIRVWDLNFFKNLKNYLVEFLYKKAEEESVQRVVSMVRGNAGINDGPEEEFDSISLELEGTGTEG